MRIVGGIWRGYPIEAPDGRDFTRPTTDRVREALASMLLSASNLSFEGLHVLDAFAGSGAIGFELLSRGCETCTFAEIERGAQARIERNARKLAVSPASYSLIKGDIFRLVEKGQLKGAPFDIVILDPPYKTEAHVITKLVERLNIFGMLSNNALVLYERLGSALSISPSCFIPLKQKRYGQTMVDLFTKEDTRHE